MTARVHDIRQSRTEDSQMRSVTEALVRRFGARLTDARVDEEVDACRQQFLSARIRTFVPLLVERDAVERLRKLEAVAS
jgi:predicted RecB family endonuclease